MKAVLKHKFNSVRNYYWILGFVCLLTALTPALGDITYIVKKRDSLSVISRRYGISVERLQSYNNLKDKNIITVGQRLLIPSQKSDPAYLANLPKGLADIKASSRWKSIVIHHSATSVGTVKGMDGAHRRRGMENGLAYHFVIGNGHGIPDGQIEIGNRWKQQLNGGHLKSELQNRTSIGICLVGNFDKTKPTNKQMDSLRDLVLFLMDRCKLDSSDIKTHQQYNIVSTRCPGKHFPTKTFIRSL